MLSEATTSHQIALWPLHAGQLEVERLARRLNYLACGRRWRKTSFVAQRMVKRALIGGRGLWAAPTSDQARIAWVEMQQACAAVPNTIIQFHETHREMIYRPLDGVIRFRSMDEPGNMRGWPADEVALDECGRREVKEAAWAEVLYPMLMDPSSAGIAWLLGTPEGMTWWARETLAALLGTDPEAMAHQIPTCGAEIVDGRLIRKPHPLENPDFQFSQLERYFERYGARRLRQEFLAEFLSDAGGVFRNIDEAFTVAAEDRILGPVTAAVDWGRTRDFTVALVFDGGRGRFLAMERFTNVTGEVQADRIARFLGQWSPQVVWAERNAIGYDACERLVKRLDLSRLSFRAVDTTNARKDAWVEHLAAEIECGRVTFPTGGAWDVVRRELAAFEMKTTPSGMRAYSAPGGLHDDCVMAACLAAFAARGTALPVASPPEPFAPTVVPYGKAKHASKVEAHAWEKVIN